MFLVVFVAMLVVMTSSTLSKARSLCCGCCVGVGRFGLKESGNLVLEDGSLLSVDLLLLGISLDGSLLLDFLGSNGLSLGGGLGFGIGLLLLVNAIESLGFEEIRFTQRNTSFLWIFLDYLGEACEVLEGHGVILDLKIK